MSLKNDLAKLARERQLGALKQNGSVGVKLPPREAEGKTRDTLADMAGVSGRTLDKVERIESEAIPEVREKARQGSVSIHATRTAKAIASKTNRVRRESKGYLWAG